MKMNHSFIQVRRRSKRSRSRTCSRSRRRKSIIYYFRRINISSVMEIDRLTFNIPNYPVSIRLRLCANERKGNGEREAALKIQSLFPRLRKGLAICTVDTLQYFFYVLYYRCCIAWHCRITVTLTLTQLVR